jgi:hypothetical protein
MNLDNNIYSNPKYFLKTAPDGSSLNMQLKRLRYARTDRSGVACSDWVSKLLRQYDFQQPPPSLTTVSTALINSIRVRRLSTGHA